MLLPATFLPLWIAFTLLPATEPLSRVPAALAVAALVGAGAELATGESTASDSYAAGDGLRWILPFGAVLCLLALIAQTGNRTAANVLAPIAALVVLAVMALQTHRSHPNRRTAALAESGLVLVGYGEALVGFGVARGLSGTTDTVLALGVAAAIALARLAPHRIAPATSIMRVALAAALFGESLAVLGGLLVGPFVATAARTLSFMVVLEGVGWTFTTEPVRSYAARIGVATALLLVLTVAERLVG
ncbi:MAG: hypothetical protein QOF51_4314 [Chloroflexota bacterium]|nr:hypothetical protein [Chloroflexota bacterium]